MSESLPKIQAEQSITKFLRSKMSKSDEKQLKDEVRRAQDSGLTNNELAVLTSKMTLDKKYRELRNEIPSLDRKMGLVRRILEV